MKHLTKRLIALALSFAMASTMTPATAQAASKKTVTVSTQAQLTKALKTKDVSKIVVKTKKEVKFTVKKGKYAAKLEIQSPKATITNHGTWSAVTVTDVTGYTEKAKNNKIVVTDKKLSFTVAKDANAKSVTFNKKGASYKVKINGAVAAMTISEPASVKVTNDGTLKKVTVDAKSAVSLGGSSKKKIALTLTKNAKSSSVSTAVPVAVKTSANVNIALKKGAEGSAVSVKIANAKVNLTNGTKDTVEVTKADGTKESVASGEKIDTSKDDSAKEDEKKDEEKKDEEKKPETGGSSTSGGSYDSGSSSGNDGDMSGTSFAGLVANAAYDENVSYGDGRGAYTVSLDENISGDVDVTFDKNEEKKESVLIINLKKYTISGSFRITAPSASAIYIRDEGVGEAGAVIKGDLEVMAPKSHVENQVSVNGTTKIHEVSDSTYCMFDKSAKFEVYGSGKIQFAQNVTNPPKIDIKTAKPVILDGAIEKIEVQANAAKIQVTSGTAISMVAIPAGYDNAVLSGEGKIEMVNASAPVEVQTEVTNVVVNSDAAKVTVGENAKISNVTVASGVNEVTVNGKVEAIDVSNAGNDIVIKATAIGTKIVVKDEEQAEEIKKNPNNADIVASVVYVKDFEVQCKSEDEKILLVTGDTLDLSGFKLLVTYSDGSKKEFAVSQSMLINPDYTSSPAGEVSIKIVYAGIEKILANIIYLDQDELTLTCSVGQKEIMVNGDGYYFDTYTIGAEYFENNGLANVIKGTSSHGLTVKFSYKPLREDGADQVWRDGLPTEAGSYVIHATTDGGEQYIDGNAFIWIISSVEKDYFEFDQTRIPDEILEKVSITLSTGNNTTDNGPVYLGNIYFKDNSFSKDVLQIILDSAVSTHNKAEISYSYFASGAYSNGVHQGLPVIPGSYCINLYVKGMLGNQSMARIFVDCGNAKRATVCTTVTGAGITVDYGQWPYENYNSTITASEGAVSIVLKNGCMNQYDVIKIPYGTAYEMDICADSNEVDVSDCQIVVVEEFVSLGNGWHEKGTKYEGEGLPTEPGRYRIIIPVKENLEKVIAETWCSFVIIIE